MWRAERWIRHYGFVYGGAMRRSSVLAVTLGVVVFTASLKGQSFFRAGVRIGTFDSRGGDEGKFYVGGCVRLRLIRLLGVEGSIDYRQEGYLNGGISVTNYPIMVTGLIYLLPGVYGLAGTGWYNARFSYDLAQLGALVPDEKQRQVGWHFGLGVDWPVTERFSLAGDVRYAIVDYDFNQVAEAEGLRTDYYSLVVAVLFNL